MTTPNELDRSISAWLDAQAPTRAPDDVLEASRDRLRHTRQRRAWLPAWRYTPMNSYAKLAGATAAVLVVGFVGYQLLPGIGGPGAPSPIAPSPTPTPLARGSFTVNDDNATELNAMGAFGAGETRTDVTGTMTVTEDGLITVDLDCARTSEGGLLVIAGTVSDSTNDSFPKGSLFGIILQRGSPVRAGFMFGPTLDGPCFTFAAGAVDGAPGLRPIEGSVELAP